MLKTDTKYICEIVQVKFTQPVSTVEHSKINEWLTMVEKEMRVTLASCLAQAVHDIKQFKDGNIDSSAYMEWCDKYQVCIENFIIQIITYINYI